MHTSNDIAGDEDDSLMADLQGGNDLALNTLMTRWEVPIRNFLFRQIHDTHISMDLAQETFVRVYQNRARYATGRSRFKTWLFTIAVNLARSHWRWRMRRPEEKLPGEIDESGKQTPLPDAMQDNQTPGTDVLRSERAETVRNAIAALPEDLRTVVLLFEYENMAQSEIAAVLECTEKAVETRLYRARKQLRDSLATYFK